MASVILIYERVEPESSDSDDDHNISFDFLSLFPNPITPSPPILSKSQIETPKTTPQYMTLVSYIYWIFKKSSYVDFINNNEMKLVQLLEIRLFNTIFDLFLQGINEIQIQHIQKKTLNNLSTTELTLDSDIFIHKLDAKETMLNLFFSELSLIYVKVSTFTFKQRVNNIEINSFETVLPKPFIYFPKNSFIQTNVKKHLPGQDLYIFMRDFIFAVDSARINYIYYNNDEQPICLQMSNLFHTISKYLTLMLYYIYQKEEIVIPKKKNIYIDIHSENFTIMEQSHIPGAGRGLKTNVPLKARTNLGNYLKPIISESNTTSYDFKYTFTGLVKKIALERDPDKFISILTKCLDYSTGSEKENNAYDYVSCPFDIYSDKGTGTVGNIKDELKIDKSQIMNDGQGSFAKEDRKENNVAFGLNDDIITLKDINKDDELLVGYGEFYWASKYHNYVGSNIILLDDIEIKKKLDKCTKKRKKEVNKIMQTIIKAKL